MEIGQNLIRCTLIWLFRLRGTMLNELISLRSSIADLSALLADYDIDVALWQTSTQVLSPHQDGFLHIISTIQDNVYIPSRCISYKIFSGIHILSSVICPLWSESACESYDLANTSFKYIFSIFIFSRLVGRYSPVCRTNIMSNHVVRIKGKWL